MWQQVTSGTPIGKSQLRRLIFRTSGATFADVKQAIASHRASEGGNDQVTLVIERPVLNASTPLAPREAGGARLEPLGDVLRRDLQIPLAKDAAAELEGLSPVERAQRTLGLRQDDVDETDAR